MGRTSFAIAVPLLALVISAVLAAELLALGLQDDMCSTHDGLAVRWEIVGGIVVVQVVVGLCFAIALGALSAIVNRRLAAIGVPRTDKRWELLAILGFIALSIAVGLLLSACRMTPFHQMGTVMLWAGVVCFASYHVLLAIDYRRCLCSGHPRGP